MTTHRTTPTSRRAALALLAAILPAGVFAQDTIVTGQTILLTPQFFLTVLAGVILALGFQSLLAALSIATGLSMTPNLKKAAAARHAEALVAAEPLDAFAASRKARQEDASTADVAEAFDESTPPQHPITTRIGLWTLISSSIALFLATLLATNLSLVGPAWLGAILGLVIWSVFFAVLTWLEMRSMRSLFGVVMHTMIQGLQSSLGAMRGMMQLVPAGARQAQGLGQNLLETIREAVSGDISQQHETTSRLRQYLDKLTRTLFDPERIRRELVTMFRDMTPTERASITEDDLNQIVSGYVEAHPRHWTADEVNTLRRLAREALQSAQTSGGPTRGRPGLRSSSAVAVESAAPEAGPMPENIRRQLQLWLASLNRPEFSYEALSADVEAILSHPSDTPAVVRNRLSQLNRDSLRALVQSYPNLSAEQADRVMEHVLSARDTALTRADTIEAEVRRRYELTRRKAVIQAEHARTSAINAAWWATGTATVAGIAAGLGGYLGMM